MQRETMVEPFFYQTIDLPGEPTHVGQWDHRATTDSFLGFTDFTGKTVLDIGPASGFWTFETERRGATVTAVELGETDRWDIVPHGGQADDAVVANMANSVAGIQAAFWYTHEKLKSSAKVRRSSVYNIENATSPVQIALMGNILQHLSNPFLAVECVSRLVTERMIISEALWIDDPEFIHSPRMHFFPIATQPQTNHSWYQVSPSLAVEWMKILGFETVTFQLHEQQFVGTNTDQVARKVAHFTCVADR